MVRAVFYNVVVALSLLLMMSACSSDPQVSEANPRSVVIELEGRDDVDGALKSAEAHCQLYNLHAQFKARLSDERLSYDCVP